MKKQSFLSGQLSLAILGLLVSGFSLLSSLAFAQSAESALLLENLSAEQVQIYKKTDALLRHLGFEDYAAVAKKNLEEEKSLSQVTKLALQKNAQSLATLNAARELADLVPVILAMPVSSASQAKKRLAIRSLVTQQLMPFPLITLEPASAEQETQIRNLGVEKGMALKKALYRKRARERFFQEKQELVKTFSQALELKNLPLETKTQIEGSLDKLVARAIVEAYTSETRQQNRFLGRALVVALVAFFRENNLSNEELLLKSELARLDLFLQNFVGGQYFFRSLEGDVRSFQLKAGDFAMEYSHGQEAFFTSLLIRPEDSKGRDLAGKTKLLNSLFDTTKFLDTSSYYQLLDKRDAFQDLSPKEISVYQNFWNTKYANGYSHSGIVDLRQDEGSGISVAWIWDIYPEKDKIGPVRLMSPEGFAYPEKHMKVAFLSYEPQKVLASFKAQIKSRGYLKNIWSGYGSFVGQYNDGTTGPSVDREETYTWPTRVSPETVQGWTQLESQQASRWYYGEVIPRVLKRVQNYAIGKDAVLFADGLVSAKDMLYCSQMMTLAFLEEINFDLQNSKDQIWTVFKYFSKTIESSLKLSVTHRLVSPNGLVWQQDIFGNLSSTFLLRDRVAAQRAQKAPTVAEAYLSRLDQALGLKDYPLSVEEDDQQDLSEEDIPLDLES